MKELLSKHESDPMNFDGKVMENLSRRDNTLCITENCRILPDRKFNLDLVIDTNDGGVCVEIEKGYLARFEYDLLKMQAFCSERIKANPAHVHMYGVFIVPADNIVASHISGNSKESSFKYLKRVCALFGRIYPPLLKDILIIGYGIEELDPPISSPVTSVNRVVRGAGLRPDEDLSSLEKYPRDLWQYIREQLFSKHPNLREKFNSRSRYFGYATDGSDAIYVYVQKKELRIDLKLPADQSEEIEACGFEVRRVENYQATAGWVTGLRVPHDTKKRVDLVNFLLEALRPEDLT